MTNVLIRIGDTGTETLGEDHVIMEAEIGGVMLPQTRDFKKSPEPGRGKERFSSSDLNDLFWISL